MENIIFNMEMDTAGIYSLSPQQKAELDFLGYNLININTVEIHQLKAYIKKHAQPVSIEGILKYISNKEKEMRKEIGNSLPIYDEVTKYEYNNISSYLYDIDIKYFNAINILQEIKSGDIMDLSSKNQTFYEFMYKNFYDLKNNKLI